MNLPPPLRQARTILIAGGTFDPPHVAHLAQAKLAAKQVNADAILYIPAGRQPQKIDKPDQASSSQRLAMLALLIQSCPIAYICTFEIDRQNDPAWRDKPNYSVDTLQALHDELSSAAPNLRLLIGSDQAANFHTWYAYEKIMTLATPAVMPRPPWTNDALIEHIALTQSPEKAKQWRHWLLDMPTMNTSSTTIRRSVKNGLPIDDMVSPEVEAYIRKHALYRGA